MSADRTFEDIPEGETASLERVIIEEDIARFAELSGDHNPLHVDAAYAAATPFGKPVVHGMLLGAFCSALLGEELPGKRCLLVSLSLSFKKPAFAGDTIMVTGTVSHKSKATRMLTIALKIMRGEETLADGTAQTLVRES